MSTTVSFDDDVRPILQQYMGQMMWRFDLTNYAAVKGNAAQINQMIQGNGMPPQPWTPLSDAEKKTFSDWVAGGCQP